MFYHVLGVYRNYYSIHYECDPTLCVIWLPGRTIDPLISLQECPQHGDQANHYQSKH